MKDLSRGLVAYFVHGRGRGHASRARYVVPQLQQHGFGVQVWSGDDALPWLEPVMPVRRIVIVKPGNARPSVWRDRITADMGELQHHAPCALITDGDGPSLVAARRAGLPSVAIGHGLIFGHAKLSKLPLWPRIREIVNAGSSSYLAQRKVAVHFLPTSPRDPFTTVARPDFPENFVSAASEPFALAYFRDDNGGALLQALVPRIQSVGIERVLCFGTAAAECRQPPPGVELLDRDPVRFRDLLTRASLIIGSAGSNLLAECVHLGKPLVCQYQQNHAEQAMNARLAERAGVAIAHRRGDDPAITAARLVKVMQQSRFKRVALSEALPSVSKAVLSTLDLLLAPKV